MNLQDLPAVNAGLNGLSTVFLLLGYRMIRRQHETAHRNLMLAAVATSTLFLISYLTYHFQVPRTEFRDPAAFRPIYLVILATHTVLAAVLLPMVLRTLWLAYRRRMEQHRRWARWTWPVWLYVSVTGVVIYLLLYQIFPQQRRIDTRPGTAAIERPAPAAQGSARMETRTVLNRGPCVS